MAEERSSPRVHQIDKHIAKYDWTYYKELWPYIQGDVLDVGCGAGMFTREYAKKDEVKSIVAIDKYIDEMPEDPKITAIRQDLPSEFNFEVKFDTIVSTEFIEHIKREELEPLLIEIKKYLKEDGVFVGSTPNKKVPTTNPFHLYEYTLEELAGILHNYFPTVEIWDNAGQNCSTWKCSLK